MRICQKNIVLHYSGTNKIFVSLLFSFLCFERASQIATQDGRFRTVIFKDEAGTNVRPDRVGSLISIRIAATKELIQLSYPS